MMLICFRKILRNHDRKPVTMTMIVMIIIPILVHLERSAFHWIFTNLLKGVKVVALRKMIRCHVSFGSVMYSMRIVT